MEGGTRPASRTRPDQIRPDQLLLLLASFRVSRIPCVAPFNGFEFGSVPQRRSKDRTINHVNPDDDYDDADADADTVASRLPTALLVLEY